MPTFTKEDQQQTDKQKRLAREKLSESLEAKQNKKLHVVCMYIKYIERTSSLKPAGGNVCTFFVFYLFVFCLQDMFLRFHSPFSYLFRNRIFPIRPMMMMMMMS